MVWASLDNALDMLLTSILGCTEDQSQCISTQVDRVSSRLSLIKTLALTTEMTNEWKSCLIEAANWITNDLCSLRNRIVHDAWDFEQLTPAQIDKRVKIRKAQSRMTQSLHMKARSEVAPKTIHDLADKVSFAAVVILSARADLEVAKGRGVRPPKVSLLENAFHTAMNPILSHLQSRRETSQPSEG